MRILQITSARALGGGEMHLIALAKGLRERGHEVHVALSTRSPLRPALDTIPDENIVMLPLRNALDAASARELARLVRDRQIEVIHAHMARDYPLAAYASRRNRSARLVITRHVMFPMSRLHAVTMSNVARVIAVSEAVAAKLREQELFASEKIVVVRNGIDVDRFIRARRESERAEFCRRLQIPPDRLLVGAVGEITKLKGHEDFVRAAAQIAAKVPRSHFIIAGEDHSRAKEHEASLKQLIQNVGLIDRVQRFGWLDNLAELYCILDVFVSASHSESFGLAIVEAMASGTAVVATATDGAREIIDDGINGRIVPIGNAEAMAAVVIELLENEDVRKKLGNAGQSRAHDQFSVERMIAETEQVYWDALIRN
jgi:L-malate glycosyltransferase